MSSYRILSLAVGTLFLAVSSMFAAVNILQHVLGIAIPWDPFEVVCAGAEASSLRYLLDAIILFGPVIAILAFTAPQIGIRFDSEAGRLATIVLHRPSRVSMLLTGASLLVLAVFAVYLIGENLPCILGQQALC